MQVLKVKSKKYKGKIYYKYRINIPEKILKSAGIRDGDELKAKTRLHEIILRK
jgi:bifunctional DNA-binding transcriptional regulator/antitoxin component of YhaV-PrlF toxin-antitoxin module